MSNTVIFDEERNLWVYQATGEPASLADTMASLTTVAEGPIEPGPGSEKLQEAARAFLAADPT